MAKVNPPLLAPGANTRLLPGRGPACTGRRVEDVLRELAFVLHSARAVRRTMTGAGAVPPQN